MNKEKETLIAFGTALGLHIIGGLVLLMSVDFSLPKDKPKNEAPIINATVVDQKLFDDLAKRKNDKIVAEQRKVEEQKKEKERIKQEKIKAEQVRKQKEADRVKAEKAEVLRKQKEAERVEAEKVLAAKQLKAKQDADKAKKVAAEKAKAERIKAEKAAAEKAKAERIRAEKAAAEKAKAEKAAAEKARKVAAEKAAKEKERLRQAELDMQMEQEFNDSFSSAQSSKQLSEIARYKALIQDKISRNWQVDSSMRGKSCTLAIRLAADGLILSVNSSRGDAQLCESAKRATQRARTLPIPKDPDISSQFRDFDITLEPEF